MLKHLAIVCRASYGTQGLVHAGQYSTLGCTPSALLLTFRQELTMFYLKCNFKIPILRLHITVAKARLT